MIPQSLCLHVLSPEPALGFAEGINSMLPGQLRWAQSLQGLQPPCKMEGSLVVTPPAIFLMGDKVTGTDF